MRGEKKKFQGRSCCIDGNSEVALRTIRGSSGNKSDEIIVEDADRIGPLPYRLPIKEDVPFGKKK